MAKKETIKNKRNESIHPITEVSAVIGLPEALSEKYTKPAEGIPSSDLAAGVIPDVSGFITRSVNDLVNYYLKSETYTKAEVQQLIAAIQGFSYEVVASLPTASADTMGVIYLVPSAGPQVQNVKDEYITIDNGASAQTRYTWEQIGSTTVNLTDYLKYTVQSLTAEQQAQARLNIGAGTSNFSANPIVSLSTPSTADGTLMATLANGDTITIDLNHNHPQYPKYEYLDDESEMPQVPEEGTLYLIGEDE